MGLARTLFNTLRLKQGKPPVLMTTSADTKGIDPVTTAVFSAIRKLFDDVTPSLHFKAESRTLLKPEKNPWDVSLVIDRYSFPLCSDSYDKVKDFLQAQEVALAKKQGMTGTDDEIIATRHDTVSKTNVLKFVPRMCPNA